MSPLGPAPIPGSAPGGDVVRPLLPRIRRPVPSARLSPGAATQAGFDFAAASSAGGPPSFFDQISNAVTGLPGGFANLAGEAVQSAIAPARIAYDIVRGEKDPREVLTNPGLTESQYSPLVAGFHQSYIDTGYRVTHPQEYVDAAKRGEIVPAVLEDVANLSIIASPLAKGLTAASGAERAAAEATAAETAGRTAAEAAAEKTVRPRYFSPSEAVPGSATRPGVFRAAQAVERIARPAEQVATAPARIWTAPIGLVKGFELPTRVFGTTEEGAAHTVGLKPLLDRTGLTERAVESPAGQAIGQAVTDWKERRAQRAWFRNEYLLPNAAELHVSTNELNKRMAPARAILGNDADLEAANHLIRTGHEANLQVLADLRDRLPEAQWNDLLYRTYGREQAPSLRAVNTALDYVNGRLDPQVRTQLDRAWGFQSQALNELEQMKLAGEGRAPLNPEQLGRAPMESKVAALTDPLTSLADQWRNELYGFTAPNGEHVPGLVDEAAARRALIPEPDMGQLAGVQAQAAARRAGALEAERVLQERTAQRAEAGAARAGTRAQTIAEQETLQGAQTALGELQQQRYGFAGYEPEWTRSTLEIGQAERAAGPAGRTGYTVPDDEFALAQRIARLGGEGRTIPVERAAARATTATERAGEAQQAGAAAAGRVFTGATESFFPRPGQMELTPAATDVAPLSEGDAVRTVREVRASVRDRVREQRLTMEANLINDGSIEIPRPDSGLRDVYDAIQQELGAGGRSNRFRNMTLRAAGGEARTLFVRGARQGEIRYRGLDELLDQYGAGTDGLAVAQERLIADLRAIKEMKQVEGAIIKNGLEGPMARDFAASPMEAAALGVGEANVVARDVQMAHADEVLPPAELGPAPWTMTREAFKTELGDHLDTLRPYVGRPFEEWTPEARRAENRLAELSPRVADPHGLTADQLYDRVRDVARVVGRDVPAETVDLGIVGQAGHEAVDQARSMAEAAVELDPLTRQRAAAEGRTVQPGELIYGSLNAEERTLYRQIVEQQRADQAAGRLGEARTNLTTGLRAEGERAGARVGAAAGQEQLLARQAQTAGARAETLAPRVETAGERAQRVAEEQAGRPMRFGERRGKLIRDVQNIEREIRTKEGKLSWLEEERIPAQQARLAQGPLEVAPGAYIPALATARRLHGALQQMGEDLAKQTGDWTMAAAFWREMADVPQTMAEFHARGIFPEYLPGAVDEPTRGVATMAGAQEQVPYDIPTPSMHRKVYGHTPKRIATVQRAMYREMQGILRNKTAQRVVDDGYAVPGHDILDRLVARGELDTVTAEALRSGVYDPTIDIAKEMERRNFTAWDPHSPNGRIADRRVTADDLFLPTPIAHEFARWFKPADKSTALRWYDMMTRGFKHAVLPLSVAWHMNNIIGNAFMAIVFGGESPAAIARAAQDVLRRARQEGRSIRELTPELAATGPAAGLRNWYRDVNVGLPRLGLPPRLFGAGQPAEIMRQMAEDTEPRTAFGRALNQSYGFNEFIDNVGRSSLFLLKKGRGFSDEQAVYMALHAMGDFANMRPFERDTARRIVPFYAWLRHITQASYRLALDHPFRTAWLLHLSTMFNPDGQDPNIPDWLRGSLGIGGGWFVPFGAMNPLQGNVGSPFTSPKQWPAELMRSLNPVIKTGAASVGINLSQGRTVSRPPGSGPLSQFGEPLWSFQAPNEIAYMTLRQIPQGRLFTDVLYNPGSNELLPRPVVRYDTGQAVHRLGREIPVAGGRGPMIAKDLNMPFVPTYVDMPSIRARIIKGRAAARSAQRHYNR